MFYQTKAIAVLNVHLQLLQWKMQNASGYNSQSTGRYKKTILLRWTADICDLVEIVYSWVEAKCINYGDIEVKVLCERLCEIFDFEVKDCHNAFREIRKRKTNRTAFLNELIEKLTERMDNADNGKYRYKKRRK